MKIILIILSLSFLFSCRPKYLPQCLEDVSSAKYSSTFFPLDEGNVWKYDIKSHDNDKYRNDYHEVVLCGTDTIYYYKDGTKEALEVFKVCVNEEKDEFFYFMKCEQGAILLSVNDYYHKEIIGELSIPNRPNQISNDDEYLIWKEEKVIKVPAGEYQVWVLELYRDVSKRDFKRHPDKIVNNKTVKTRYYFSQGVGLIKTEEYGGPGELLYEMELTEFNVKQKAKSPEKGVK